MIKLSINENQILDFIKEHDFLGIQELYEKVKNDRNRNAEERIKNVIEKEFNKIQKNISKFWDWNEDEKVYNTFLIATYLEKDKGLKTAQIRKILDRFKAIQNKYKLKTQDFNRDEVIRIRPLLAYAAGRNKKQVLPLVKVLDPLILRIEGYPDFNKFFKFIESIVAFHKFLGGE
ncbi:MAG: type III-A CRISPR-associated protein Csm2 [Candidatus Helarchaeota archaeon]